MPLASTAPSSSNSNSNSSLVASSLTTLPPELVAEIPDRLPIVCRPAALISLALTCRSLCYIIIPKMLYRAVWLEGEGRALSILGRFNAQLSQGPQLSRHIRYLSIVSGLSKTVREGPTNVLQELRTLVSAGGLRNLIAFTLHLEYGWFFDNDAKRVLHGFGELGPSFWDALAKNCPLIAHVHLTGLIEYHDHRWIADSGIFEFKGLKSLRVIENGRSNSDTVTGFFSRVDSDSKSSIEVLELCMPDRFGLLNSVQFSNLRTLILVGGADNVFVSEFWKNHSKLERIELCGYIAGDSGFSGMSSSWLPNLQNLKCGFFTAKALLPYVHSQLINLTLVDTVDAQVLYLLRVITPTGTMAQLRSLGVQVMSSLNSFHETLEGNTWVDDEDGSDSDTSKRGIMRYFDASYVATLAKAAPNLEELELFGISKENIHKLTSSLQHFHRLHTLIVSGAACNLAFFRSSVNWSQYGTAIRRYRHSPGTYAPSSLQDAASDLGNGCRTLEQIRFTSCLGYLFDRLDLTAVIVRDGIAGPVRELKIRKGWGRLIGQEDEW